VRSASCCVWRGRSSVRGLRRWSRVVWR